MCIVHNFADGLLKAPMLPNSSFVGWMPPLNIMNSMPILKSSSMHPAGCNLNRIAADFIVCSLLLYSGSFKPFTVTGACFPTLTELHSSTLASRVAIIQPVRSYLETNLNYVPLDIKHLWFVKGWNYQFMYFISERNKHSLNLEAWLHCYIVSLFSVSGPTLQTS